MYRKIYGFFYGCNISLLDSVGLRFFDGSTVAFGLENFYLNNFLYQLVLTVKCKRKLWYSKKKGRITRFLLLFVLKFSLYRQFVIEKTIDMWVENPNKNVYCYSFCIVFSWKKYWKFDLFETKPSQYNTSLFQNYSISTFSLLPTL